MQFFMQGGPFMWLILLFMIIAIIFIAKSTVKIFGKGDYDKKIVENNLNTALWMGFLSSAIGLLGTATGFYHAAGAIGRATEISAFVIWGGIQVALTTLIFGLWIYIFTVIVVLLLKAKLK